MTDRGLLSESKQQIGHSGGPRGASGLADRAHEELVAAPRAYGAIGGFVVAGESLTASEDRMAALAGEGLSNREIARRPVCVGQTVQWHLRNGYRKLDIGSRGELPAALGLGA